MTFLGVLKIIGFILLGIVALILLIVLTVLIWPFRYKIEADYHKEIKAKFTVSFFFQAIRVLLSFEDMTPLLKAKILWFTVYTYDLRKLFEEQEEKEEEVSPDVTDEELSAILTDAENADTYEKQEDGTWKSMGSASEPDNAVTGNQSEDSREETGEEDFSYEEIPEAEVDAFVEEELKKKQSLEDILLEFVDNIKKGIQNFKKKCYNLKVKAEEIPKKIKRYYKLARHYYKILTYKSMKPALKMVLKTLKGMLKHIRPRKAKIHLHYGSDDPSETAKMLAYYSMIYPYFRKQIRFEADFDNKIIEGEGWIKGRFQIIVFAFLVIRAYLNKHVRIMIKILIREVKRHG